MASQEQPPSSGINYSSKYVLVVDDFPQQLEFIRKALLEIGFTRIELAKSPREALAKCKEVTFDIIFCDYNMGEGKNGQQLMQEIRHYRITRFDCIYIMITAETSREVVLGAVESEPDGYVVKPFNEAVLKRKIDRLLDRQSILSPINNAIEKEDFDLAIELCQSIGGSTPRYNSWCVRTEAELLCKLEKYREAKRIYTDFLNKRVLDWALLGLAKTYICLGEYEKACTELQQALVLNSNCVAAYDLLAECHLHLKDQRAIQTNLTKAATISPLSQKRQEFLGDVCSANGDYEEASKAYRMAIRSAKYSFDESPKGYFKLANALSDSMVGDRSKYDGKKVSEALKVLKEIDARFDPSETMEIRKELVSTRLNLNQQKYDQALSGIAKVQESKIVEDGRLEPSSVVELGETLLSLGDSETASKILKPLLLSNDVSDSEKLRIKSSLSQALVGGSGERSKELNEKGAQLYEEGDLHGAIKMFSEAYRLTPKSPVVNLNLVQALVRFMETDEYSEEFADQCSACFESMNEPAEQSSHSVRYKRLLEQFKKLQSENSG